MHLPSNQHYIEKSQEIMTAPNSPRLQYTELENVYFLFSHLPKHLILSCWKIKDEVSIHFGHLMQRVDSLEKTLMLGGFGSRRRRRQQRMRWLDGVTN